MNAAWHENNKMAKKATPDMRLQWHLRHAAACGCRKIPRSVLVLMKARGISPPPRRSASSLEPPSGPRAPRSGAKRGVTWAILREMALELPGVEEGTSYGTPAFHVRRKLLFRLKEDKASIAIRVAFDDREVLLRLDPRAFYLTDHYRAYPAMLVRLSEARPALLKELIGQTWRAAAPPSLLKALPSPTEDKITAIGVVSGDERRAKKRKAV